MRFYIKTSIALLSLVLIAILFIYAMPQTKQLGPWFAKVISSQAGYNVKFTDIQHSFSQKDTLIVNNIEIKSQTGTLILSAEKLVLRVKDWTAVKSDLDFKLIYLENGIINFTHFPNQQQIKTDSLQLKNIRLNATIDDYSMQATGLTAQIAPWHNQSYDWLLKDNDLAISAKTIKINQSSDLLSDKVTLSIIPDNVASIFGSHFEFKNVILKSKRLDGIIFINEMGLDWLEGSITAKARIQPKKQWFFDYLYVDNLTHYVDLSIADIVNNRARAYSFKEATITNSTLSGKDWNLDNLYLDVHNLELEGTQLQGTDRHVKSKGDITLSGDTFSFKDLNLGQPSLMLNLNDDVWSIKRASANLLSGFISLTGIYETKSQTLTLDSVLANDFNINIQSLPSELLLLSESFNRINTLTISALQLKNISLQSINQVLPWQIRNLALDGKALKFIENKKIGLYSGYLSSVINNLSINSIDFSSGASFRVLADKSQILAHEIKAATDMGVLEISAFSIDRQDPANFKFSLTAQSIEKRILEAWYWPKLPLTQAQGALVNIELEATGILPTNVWESLLGHSQSTKTDPALNLVEKLQLSGTMSVSNTAAHGLSDLRFSLNQSILNGKVIESNYQEQPSVNALKALLETNQNANYTQKLAIQTQIENQVYQQIDELFEVYQSILNSKIDYKLNQLRTAPFFENQPK